ncbi:MAG: hypothetical protein JNK11_07370 [Alphaproteobacteria bacterium]|nr:hypothetical protein [Alphaproteobacteria bacterium]
MTHHLETSNPAIKLLGSQAIVDAIYQVDLQEFDYEEAVGGRTPEGKPRPPRVVLTEKKSKKVFTIEPGKIGHIDLPHHTLYLQVEAYRGNSKQFNLALDKKMLEERFATATQRVSYQVDTPDAERSEEAAKRHRSPLDDMPLFPRY